jgi:glycerate dehydrogenase
MRIVVLDGYTLNPGDNPWTLIERLGNVTIHDHTPPELILERSAGNDIIITNKAVLSADTIAHHAELKFIAVTATGYNVVDIDAAARRGIPVSNVPAYASDAVAQFTFALLLELCHRVALHDSSVHAGDWQRSRDFAFWKTPQVELTGKKMGIIGFGSIGQRVGEVAHAMGMQVLAFNPSTKPKPAYEPFAFRTLEQVFAESDVVSLHCPLTQRNREMVNAALLATMKPSAFFINTARGLLVNERDLVDALNANKLAGAAVDVVSAEPISPDNPLLGAKNLIITPHIAWAAYEARQRAMKITADNIAAFIAGKPINVVNAALLKR